MIKLEGRGHFRTLLRKTILLYYKGHGADIVCNSVGYVILVHKRLKYFFFWLINHIIEYPLHDQSFKARYTKYTKVPLTRITRSL